MPFIVTMMLADAAQAVEGKLYILGGGWSVLAATPQPTAIAIYIKVPWDSANARHRMLLELLDADGQPVLVEGSAGPEAIRIENDFEVGRPPGVKPGTALDLVLAVNIGPLPLAPDQGYAWRLSIDGETHEYWSVRFVTRPTTLTAGP